LTVIGPPALGPVVSAPPVLNASDHTIEYVCGHCQAALLHAEEDEIRNLQIQCTRCGRYNRTEV
jgi:DNA-directed RNA polymerase subunit RPC12/RpoP